MVYIEERFKNAGNKRIEELVMVATRLMMGNVAIWNRHGWKNQADLVPGTYLKEVNLIKQPYMSLNHQEKKMVIDMLEYNNHHSLIEVLTRYDGN
jgi:hypothetical protein